MELCMNLKLSKTFEKCEKNMPLPLLLWTPFSCFSFLFFSKNWIVHSVTAETHKFLVTITIVLARRTCVFFFAFFRRAKASVMREGRGKTTPAKHALLFRLFQASTKRAWRARHARALRRRLFARLKKREHSAFVLQATIPLLNKACPCDRQCVS